MLFLASHRIADIVGKLANGQEFDSPLSSIYQKLSTKNIGDKRYLPHTLTMKKWGMGGLEEKLKENCLVAKDIWNDLTLTQN